MALGVTQYNPLAQDPDYPQAKSNVSDASKITNPNAMQTPTGITSNIPSAPTLVPGFESVSAALSRGEYEAGAGQNDLLSKAWWKIDPKDTALGGVNGPKAPVFDFRSTGTGTGKSASDLLALARFNYEKQQDAQKLGGMQSYYDSGSANKGFDVLLKMIGDQGTVSENAVKSAYDKAIANVDQGYEAAQGLGDSGYSALNTYLAANQNNPYAGMQATVGSAPDALTQYLSAYGVSDQPVQGQIQADQLQAQQGAGNYQNLINLLSSVAQSGASSRGAESAMGQNLFNTTLGQERAGYKTKAEMAQADAMRQIQEIMYQQRLANESSRNAQMQSLAQALAAAGGDATGGGETTTVTTQPPVEVETQTPFVPLPGHLLETASPEELVANQLANLLAPAQARGTSAQQLLDELNARRGR
jgi:hypothetical protein